MILSLIHTMVLTSQLLRISEVDASGTTVAVVAYAYDGSDNLTTVTRTS